ncbi:sn-glycerol 3-phosphate transport system ATP-binding protein [Neorhizobium huautlense]|uniref:Sn-glycerol 3-phosphate transport system ATP-binding protein n=1 Tax=Neorhizobium huautlense TaxID=67774 RepID=A0ABT9Q0C6_9HYPH|nr:ABC transporter ATP-binding protein [Neorhizobium huautlense]MDP9839793.1 sn-glycerol 3-phosphate transport system ATP-binding protein [Neorhizobium huautlense]
MDISVSHLVKDWGTSRAVDDISFAAEKGQFIALLGPSGCGKSTTLRLIAGLDDATSGTIAIGDRDVTRLMPAKRGLSMVFQSYALFPHLTAAENILFGLSVRGFSKGEQQAKLKLTADMLGLEHLLDRRPSQMSGGQQQRVALGRALIAETSVCLLDEPLSNLDAKLRAGMRTEIRSLQKRLGITMLYVTHDQTEAMSMADQVILMNGGRIEQAGSPTDLYEKPASVFAARFIGTPPMNVLDLAKVEGGMGLPGSMRLLAAQTSGELQLGIRPEHIHLSDDGEPAVVQASEYFGADTILTCCIGPQSLQVRLPGRAGVSEGAAIRLGWSPTALQFFDRSTGLRRDDVTVFKNP